MSITPSDSWEAFRQKHYSEFYKFEKEDEETEEPPTIDTVEEVYVTHSNGSKKPVESCQYCR